MRRALPRLAQVFDAHEAVAFVVEATFVDAHTVVGPAGFEGRHDLAEHDLLDAPAPGWNMR